MPYHLVPCFSQASLKAHIELLEKRQNSSGGGGAAIGVAAGIESSGGVGGGSGRFSPSPGLPLAPLSVGSSRPPRPGNSTSPYLSTTEAAIEAASAISYLTPAAGTFESGAGVGVNASVGTSGGAGAGGRGSQSPTLSLTGSDGKFRLSLSLASSSFVDYKFTRKTRIHKSTSTAVRLCVVHM
jgi:hypothetical protein